jgi:hypothetical protein
MPVIFFGAFCGHPLQKKTSLGTRWQKTRWHPLAPVGKKTRWQKNQLAHVGTRSHLGTLFVVFGVPFQSWIFNEKWEWWRGLGWAGLAPQNT